MNKMILFSSSGSQDLESISLGVAIAVIGLLAITYIMLFYIWHRYYAKCIQHGLEDQSLKRVIMEEYKEFLKPIPAKLIVQDTLLEQKSNTPIDFDTVTQHVEFKKKRMSLSLNLILGVLYLLMILLFGFGIYSRVTTGLTNYFGNSYLVIKTGSMESKNRANEYLFQYDLNNQIKQYSLIQLDNEYQKRMNLYDIYAFYDHEGNIIVHRLITIKEEDGIKKYTFRGDANTVSASYEREITLDKVIGHYNGTNNFILGVCNLYLSSNIGLITVFFAFSSALFFDIFEAKANIVETQRKKILLKQIFPVIEKKLKKNEVKLRIRIAYNHKDESFIKKLFSTKKKIYLVDKDKDNHPSENKIKKNTDEGFVIKKPKKK